MPSVCAPFVFMYSLLGGKSGLLGLTLLVVGSTLSAVISVYVSFLAGMAAMVAGFAGCFATGALWAADGRYDEARPVLFTSLLLIVTGVLGGHFFRTYHQDIVGTVTFRDVSVAMAANITHHGRGTRFYFNDGSVSLGRV